MIVVTHEMHFARRPPIAWSSSRRAGDRGGSSGADAQQPAPAPRPRFPAPIPGPLSGLRYAPRRARSLVASIRRVYGCRPSNAGRSDDDEPTNFANPYAVLGVAPTASATGRCARPIGASRSSSIRTDIRDAQATERMQRINQAWETLSSPAARARYDAQAAVIAAAAYPHWGSAQRAYSSASYPAQPSWRASQAAYARGSRARRQAAVRCAGASSLVAVPAVVLAGSAVRWARARCPILGLLVFFLARTVFRAGDSRDR